MAARPQFEVLIAHRMFLEHIVDGVLKIGGDFDSGFGLGHLADRLDRLPHRFQVLRAIVDGAYDIHEEELLDSQRIVLPDEAALEFVLRLWLADLDQLLEPRLTDVPWSCTARFKISRAISA